MSDNGLSPSDIVQQLQTNLILSDTYCPKKARIWPTLNRCHILLLSCCAALRSSRERERERGNFFFVRPSILYPDLSMNIIKPKRLRRLKNFFPDISILCMVSQKKFQMVFKRSPNDQMLIYIFIPRRLILSIKHLKGLKLVSISVREIFDSNLVSFDSPLNFEVHDTKQYIRQ